METNLNNTSNFKGRKNGLENVYFIYVLLLFAFLVSTFLQISTSVVLTEIQNEIPLSLSQIAFVSSVYFYSQGLMQPLVGYLNDNNNPEVVVIIGLLIVEIGIIIFGLCQSFGGLVLSRLLMGVGVSPAFSALVVYQNLKFPAERYSFYLGISMAVGGLGGVVASRPLAFLLEIWGRQKLFIVLFFAVLVLIIILYIKSNKPFRFNIKFQDKENKIAYKQVFSIIKNNKNLRRNILVVVVFAGVISSFQGLWAYPWFKESFNGDVKQAGFAFTCYNLGLIFGNLYSTKIFPPDTNRMRNIKHTSSLFFIYFLALLIAFACNCSFIIIVILATASGFVFSIGAVQRSSGINDLAPKNMKGSVFGVVNLIIFSADILYQTVTGLLIDGFENKTTLSNAFILTFAIVEFTVLLAVIEARKLEKNAGGKLNNKV